MTAELANLAVDQCELVDERFTLIAPDNYRGDFIEVKLWDKRGEELAVESLYVDDGRTRTTLGRGRRRRRGRGDAASAGEPVGATTSRARFASRGAGG